MHQYDPIGMLVHEHEIIKKVVAGLSTMARDVTDGGRGDPETLKGIVRFMREFADRCHHAKEEDLLFPAMERKGVPESGCPLGALRREHRDARALVTALASTVEKYAADEAAARGELTDIIGKIAKLYTDHMWKEDVMVFPMVERLFSDAERRDLFERFEKAESEIGADHEALARFANALAHRATV